VKGVHKASVAKLNLVNRKPIRDDLQGKPWCWPAYFAANEIMQFVLEIRNETCLTEKHHGNVIPCFRICDKRALFIL